MHVIGAGIGRTGTYSLKLAINQLGLGPTHHMEAVLHNIPVQAPLWQTALTGRADWASIYSGYASAVDWPTAAFFRELVEDFPDAKFVLTVRSPESWADSFGSTIYKLLAAKDEALGDKKAWLNMADAVISRSGMPHGLDRDGLMQAYVAHNKAVKATIPASRLLIFEVKDGWAPLCAFLDKPVPDSAFPRTNDRNEFWTLVSA